MTTFERKCQRLTLVHKQPVPREPVSYMEYPEELRKWRKELMELFLLEKPLLNRDYKDLYEKIEDCPIDRLDSEEIIVIMIYLSKSEQFSNGMLANAVENGTLEAMGRRLRELTKNEEEAEAFYPVKPYDLQCIIDETADKMSPMKGKVDYFHDQSLHIWYMTIYLSERDVRPLYSLRIVFRETGEFDHYTLIVIGASEDYYDFTMSSKEICDCFYQGKQELKYPHEIPMSFS